jgi:hypothetical protein
MRIVDSFPEMPTQLPGGVRPFEYGLLWLLTRACGSAWRLFWK